MYGSGLVKATIGTLNQQKASVTTVGHWLLPMVIKLIASVAILNFTVVLLPNDSEMTGKYCFVIAWTPWHATTQAFHSWWASGSCCESSCRNANWMTQSLLSSKSFTNLGRYLLWAMHGKRINTLSFTSLFQLQVQRYIIPQEIQRRCKSMYMRICMYMPQATVKLLCASRFTYLVLTVSVVTTNHAQTYPYHFGT